MAKTTTAYRLPSCTDVISICRNCCLSSSYLAIFPLSSLTAAKSAMFSSNWTVNFRLSLTSLSSSLRNWAPSSLWCQPIQTYINIHRSVCQPDYLSSHSDSVLESNSIDWAGRVQGTHHTLQCRSYAELPEFRWFMRLVVVASL